MSVDMPRLLLKAARLRNSADLVPKTETWIVLARYQCQRSYLKPVFSVAIIFVEILIRLFLASVPLELVSRPSWLNPALRHRPPLWGAESSVSLDVYVRSPHFK